MQTIFLNDGPVSQSKNLAGVRRYAGENAAVTVFLNRTENFAGMLRIVFENGATFETLFVSYEVLKGFVRRWRNVYGADLQIDNEVRGQVEYGNGELK